MIAIWSNVHRFIIVGVDKLVRLVIVALVPFLLGSASDVGGRISWSSGKVPSLLNVESRAWVRMWTERHIWFRTGRSQIDTELCI